MSATNHLLEALEPVVAENLDRHLAMAQEWHPHDDVPWSEGRLGSSNVGRRTVLGSPPDQTATRRPTSPPDPGWMLRIV